MRPTLNVLDEGLILRILDEAKRILGHEPAAESRADASGAAQGVTS